VAWRDYVCKQLPGVKDLGPESKIFHLFNPTSGEAISTETLYTLAPGYIGNPQAICDDLKVYIDAVADYAPASQNDLALVQIKSKTIHLAVPERTSPVQWRYLFRAERYANHRNVSMIVTQIRE
jgi:filamentous hemagglutinin